MPSTINLLGTVNWAETFVNYKPILSGCQSEPALTNANIILQTILGAPFTWRWNRTTSSPFTGKKGTTDNLVALPLFGNLEKAYVQAVSGPDQKAYEIPEIVNVAGPSVETDRPHSVCALLDDEAGNITVRVSPAYDQDYQVSLIYQRQAQLMIAPSSLWAPIPDALSYIYNHGFLALELLFDDDPRFQIINSRFVSSLLSTAEGITEMQRNAFLDKWGTQIGQLGSDEAKRNQGSRARGGL